MLRTWSRMLLLLFATGLGAAAAEGPGRAYRDRVQPRWFADNTKFWYRVNVARDQYEFVVVDAEKGLRQAAFDHQRLATALEKIGIKESDPRKLPLQNLEFEDNGEAIRFQAGGKAWRCDLKTFELLEQAGGRATPRAGLEPANAPRASRRTGEETHITFINRTGGEVKLFWLDPDGQRQGYGTLAPGQSRDQHTFAGHVWLVTDSRDKSLVVFVAAEAGGEAPITGENQTGARTNKKE